MSTDDPTLQLPSDAPRDAVPTSGRTPPPNPPTVSPTPVETPATAAGSASTYAETSRATAPTSTETGTPRHRLRVGTAVWGLVIAAIGAGILAVSLGAEIDLELATILLLGFAGVAMLVGSIVGGVRRERDRGRDRP